MVIMGRGRFQAGQLTNILQLAADLQLDDQTLLDRVSQTLMTRIGTMTAEELTQLVSFRSLYSFMQGIRYQGIALEAPPKSVNQWRPVAAVDLHTSTEHKVVGHK